MAHVPPFKHFLRGGLQSGFTPKNAWVFSGVGRSLPPPCKEGAKETAVRQQIERLTTPFKTRPEILEKLYSFTKNWVHGHSKKLRYSKPVRLHPIKLNASACLENSRSKGGAYEYYRKRANKIRGRFDFVFEDQGTLDLDKLNVNPVTGEPEERQVCVDPYYEVAASSAIGNNAIYPTQQGINPDWSLSTRVFAMEKVVQSLAVSDVHEEVTEWHQYGKRLKDPPEDLGLYEETSHDRLYKRMPKRYQSFPLMKSLALPERGMKMRVASISAARYVVLGQQINGLLLDLLRTDRIHSYSLAGGKGIPKALKDGTRDYAGFKDFEYLSADLSAASDFIPHDAARTIWDAICDELGSDIIPPIYQSVGQRCIGPQRVVMEDGKEITTRRGILMGLPLTWPILSLMQEFCALQNA